MTPANLLDRFAGPAATEEEDDQGRIERRAFVLAAVLYGLLGIVWGSVYLALGLILPALIPYSYVAFAVVFLALLARTRWFELARTAVLVSWLLLPLALQLSMGGFVPGSAVVLWSVASPLGALVFAPKQASLWATAFIIALGVAWLLDSAVQPETVVTAGTIRAFFALNLVGVGIAVFLVLRDFLHRLQRARSELRIEQERSDRLLLNVLPDTIARRLKDGEDVIADRLDEVTIVFGDIVDFTLIAESVKATELVRILNALIADFDRLATRHGVEKIRTEGDAYMVVSGAPSPRSDHAAAAARMALDMLKTAHDHLDPTGSSLQMRIGMDSGPVVAGVIGLHKFVYDVWGDPVNTASRMESHGLPGHIQVTSRVYEGIRDSFELEERGVIDVKGKGPMPTYFLLGEARQNLE